MERKPILVTSAAGFTGQNVILALKRERMHVLAFVRNAKQEQIVSGLGADEAAVGDIRDAAAVAKAVGRASAVYFICPRFVEDEPAIGRLWIEQCEAHGRPRFVYHGVAHPYIAEMRHHWDKLQVQLMLERSSLSFAVLQPTNYMRNVTWAWDQLIEERVYRLPYSPDAPVTWVDADDVAEAAVKVLTEDGYEFGVFELCGTDGGVSRAQLCAMLSERLGMAIRAESASWEAWRQLPRYRGWTEGQMERLKAMFAYYDRHGFRAGNTKVLAMLLGRRPTSYAEYLDRLLALPPERRQAVL
jgi:uncharacterized protein YbjT (DUF2867 family)